MRRKLNYNLIQELHSQGMNDNEIARALNASVNGVRYVRKTILGLKHNTKHYTLTKEMESIIIGTLLGDACVLYVHKGCKYPSYQCSHCEKQYDYLQMIYSKLKSIMTPTITEHKEHILYIKGKKYKRDKSYSIRSRNCDCLIPFRDAFYPKDKKVIPIEFIKNKFDKTSLAYWFMDDGSLDRKRSSFILNTQCFTKENLKEFIEFLYTKFGLLFTIKKDNSLYLKHCCNSLFQDLISDSITKDMRYKLLSSLNSVKQGNS